MRWTLEPLVKPCGGVTDGPMGDGEGREGQAQLRGRVGEDKGGTHAGHARERSQQTVR